MLLTTNSSPQPTKPQRQSTTTDGAAPPPESNMRKNTKFEHCRRCVAAAVAVRRRRGAEGALELCHDAREADLGCKRRRDRRPWRGQPAVDWILTSASPTQQTEKRRFERVYDEDLSSGGDNPATRIHFAKRVRAREDSSDHTRQTTANERCWW